MIRVDDLKFAISSHKSFIEKTYPYIITSLIDSGINPKNIYLFIGGYDNYSTNTSEDGITVYYVPHNSFEFTALISIVELWEENNQIFPIDTNWFLLHDTCKAGTQFKLKLQERFQTLPLSEPSHKAVKMYYRYSMNIGMYSLPYLVEKRDELLSFKGKEGDTDQLLALKKKTVDREDILLKGSPVLNTSKYMEFTPIDFYESNTPRKVEYYPDVDLYKIKSNWEQKSSYSITI